MINSLVKMDYMDELQGIWVVSPTISTDGGAPCSAAPDTGGDDDGNSQSSGKTEMSVNATNTTDWR